MQIPENRKIPGSAGFQTYLVLALAPLSWGGNVVVARGVYELIPPVGFAFWRWIVAIAILLPFSWKFARRDLPVALASWKMMTLLSISGVSGFAVLLYAAVHTTTAINGALLQTLIPAAIILMTFTLYREKVTRLQIIGVALCIFGACVIVLRGNLGTIAKFSFVVGDFLMIAAVVLYAVYSALLRKRPDIHPLSFLIFTFVIGDLILFPIYIVELICTGPFALSSGVVSSILFVAAFPSVVAYFCWNYGVASLGANRAGLFVNLVPVFASIMAIIWLGESLHLFHLGGMTLILAGMLLFNYVKNQ